MTLRPPPAARHDSDVPTRAGASTTSPAAQDAHPAPSPGGPRRRARAAAPAARTPEHRDQAGEEPPLTPVQQIMRARLAAMSTPRRSDDPETARLRALLRDWEAMAEVTATVDQWPPITDDQRETLAALLHPHRGRPHRPAG